MVVSSVLDALDRLPTEPADRLECLGSDVLTLASFLASVRAGIPPHDGTSWLEWAFGVDDCRSLFPADERAAASSWRDYSARYPDVPAVGMLFSEVSLPELLRLDDDSRSRLRILDHAGRLSGEEGFDGGSAVECEPVSAFLAVSMKKFHPDAAFTLSAAEATSGILCPRIMDMADSSGPDPRADRLESALFFPLAPEFRPVSGSRPRKPVIAAPSAASVSAGPTSAS